MTQTPAQAAAFAANRAAAQATRKLATRNRLLDLLCSDAGCQLTPKQLAYELGLNVKYVRLMIKQLEKELTL